MKHLFTSLFYVISLLSSLHAVAQTRERRHMVRLYEDNDVLNLIGDRTDRSYTNGSRIDYFCESRLKKNSFLYKILPVAGDSSVNVSGWSVAQIMLTPEDISKVEYQPDDYPYAGSLFVTRSLHSYNSKKKFSYQTELLVGLRGRYSFAKQTQIAMHSLINATEPRGWHNQLNTQLLVNVLFVAEKNLFSWNNIVELNGGIQTRVGSLMDAVHIYPLLRVGKMSPYFNGYLDQYGSYKKNGKKARMQYYLTFRPIASFIAYNAMLQGTRENAEGENVAKVSLPISHHTIDLQFGAVIAYGNFGFSYLLTRSASYDKGLYEHRFGTVELYYRW